MLVNVESSVYCLYHADKFLSLFALGDKPSLLYVKGISNSFISQISYFGQKFYRTWVIVLTD